MTANQIAYQNMLETHRSNVAKETETYRSNVTKERETQRHNLLTEGIARDTLTESIRHNKVSEQELNRHNIQTERLGWSTLGEQIRHNQVNESLDSSRVAIQAVQARTAIYDAETRRMKQQQDYILGKVQQTTNRINAITQRKNANTQMWQTAISGASGANESAYKSAKIDVDSTNAIWGNINDTIRAIGSVITGGKKK